MTNYSPKTMGAAFEISKKAGKVADALAVLELCLEEQGLNEPAFLNLIERFKKELGKEVCIQIDSADQ